MLKKIELLLVFLLISNTFFAQETDISSKENIFSREDAIKIFLDCNFCDLQHIKEQITYVNYVRDSKEAQVHILVSRELAGNGGNKFTFIFFGQKEYEAKNDTLSFVSRQDNTSDEIRTEQIKILKNGLMYYVAHSSAAEFIDINYTKKTETESIVEDKWNSWVFKTRANGWFNGQSSYKSASIWSSFEVEKVTPDWKIEFRVGSDYSRDKYVFDDDEIINEQKSWYFRQQTVKSLNEHWSIGGKMFVSSDSYSNYKLYYKVSPAIEYNFYPYSESTTKQLRILFSSGYRKNIYVDTTIYDQTEEDFLIQDIEIAYKIKKKWGSINTSVTGSTFLRDLSKNHLRVDAFLDIRIVKGLTFSMRGSYSIIHDQVNLPKGGASLEETLLRQQQIATDFSYRGSVGLSYTFGSVYNNVVNPRFGY